MPRRKLSAGPDVCNLPPLAIKPEGSRLPHVTAEAVGTTWHGDWTMTTDEASILRPAEETLRLLRACVGGCARHNTDAPAPLASDRWSPFVQWWAVSVLPHHQQHTGSFFQGTASICHVYLFSFLFLFDWLKLVPMLWLMSWWTCSNWMWNWFLAGSSGIHPVFCWWSIKVASLGSITLTAAEIQVC